MIDKGKVKWGIFKRKWDETMKLAKFLRKDKVVVYIRTKESLEEKVKDLRNRSSQNAFK